MAAESAPEGILAPVLSAIERFNSTPARELSRLSAVLSPRDLV
jgi:hypothetical protein